MTPRHLLSELESDAFSTALRRIFELRKLESPRFSLAYLCKHSAINSRGYLSDVLTGKRRLSIRYLDKLLNVLKLAPDEQELMRLLWQRAGTRNKAKREELSAEIARLKRALKVTHPPLLLADKSRSQTQVTLAFKVFAAFDLCGGKPTKAQLVRLFAMHSAREIDDALTLLEELKIVQRQDECFGIHTDMILFQQSPAGISEIEYTKAAIQDGIGAVDAWFDRREMACFSSILLSVKRDEYQSYMLRLKRQLNVDLAQLATSDGDMLVSFNLQFYPVLSTTPHLSSGEKHESHEFHEFHEFQV